MILIILNRDIKTQFFPLMLFLTSFLKSSFLFFKSSYNIDLKLGTFHIFISKVFCVFQCIIEDCNRVLADLLKSTHCKSFVAVGRSVIICQCMFN